MKNTKELNAILASIFCINFSECRDNDIYNIIEYAYGRLFGGNTNLNTLACVGKTKEHLMPEIMQVLEADTQYSKFLETRKPVNFKPKTIYTVLVDWMNKSGDSDVKSYLFSTLEKAKKQLRKECLTELESHRDDDIFCDEGCDEIYIKELLAELDNGFNLMNREENANWVIDANPKYFSCYKQGKYSEYHFNIRIVEQTINEAPDKESCTDCLEDKKQGGTQQ